MGEAHSHWGTAIGHTPGKGTQGLRPRLAGPRGRARSPTPLGTGLGSFPWRITWGRAYRCADWQPEIFGFPLFGCKFNPLYHHFQNNPQILSPKHCCSPISHPENPSDKSSTPPPFFFFKLGTTSFLTFSASHPPPLNRSPPPPGKKGLLVVGGSLDPMAALVSSCIPGSHYQWGGDGD